MKKEYELKPLTLSDLRIGMRVYVRQLYGIYKTFIYLKDTEYDKSMYDTVGTIAYFGDKSVTEAGLKHEDVLVVYFPYEDDYSEELDDE